MRIVALGLRGFPDVQGGVERHCENLYSRLAHSGCKVIVLARRPYLGKNHAVCKGLRLISLACPKNKFLETFLHTLSGLFIARRLKPDVVHIHAVGPSLFVPLARLMQLKVVMTNHGPDYNRQKWNKVAKAVLKLGERMGSLWANEIICISEAIRRDVNNRYHRASYVIPNGVSISETEGPMEALDSYHLNRGRYILTVGRFVPEKGFHDLIDAFNLLRERNAQIREEGWKLVLVGTADHADQYSRGLVQKARDNGSIVMTGFLTGKRLESIYSHAGLFVLPSYHEGLPISLLEGMSYKLSCIASDIPANKEVDLSPDRYFKPGNIGGLADKIEEFLSRPLREEEKASQLGLLRDRYDWDNIAQKTLHVYQKIADDR